jgi:hypothetical protein
MRLTPHACVGTGMEILGKRSWDKILVKPCCYGNGMVTDLATRMSITFGSVLIVLTWIRTGSSRSYFK